MTSRLLQVTAVALALLLPAAAPSIARAGNDNEMLMGNRAAMTAAAVVANVSDPSSTWYNPAGLGAIDRDQFDVSGTAYTMRFYSADAFISTVDGESADATVTEFVSIPTQIAYVRKLDDGVVLGLGYFVPNTSNLVLREQVDAGSANNGSTWQLTMAAASTQHTAAAALGLALSPRVRLGFSLVGSYEVATQGLTFFGTVRRGGVSRSLVSTTSLASVTRIGFEAGAGLQADVSDHLSLGLAMRGPRLRVSQTGEIAVADSGALNDDVAGMALVADAKLADVNSGVDIARTGHATLGVTYRHAHGWLSAEADVEPGLRRIKADVDRHLLLNARVGVYQALTETVALGFGLFTDRTPRSLNVDPGSAEGDFYGGTLGLELGNKHLLAADESVDSLIFSTVFALRYAFSSATVGRLIADPDDFEQPLRAANGKLRAHELGLFVGSGLQF